MLETLITSLFTLDVSLLLLIINKAYQPTMTQKQEEDLPDYQEHQKGWEFKILRTANNGFQHRKVLKLVCEEELGAGWILLEKLDDSRLRFRRPIQFRERDHLSQLDPYRTYYGSPLKIGNFIRIALIITFMAIPTFLGFKFMQNIFKSVSTQNLQPNPKPQPPASSKPVPPVKP